MRYAGDDLEVIRDGMGELDRRLNDIVVGLQYLTCSLNAVAQFYMSRTLLEENPLLTSEKALRQASMLLEPEDKPIE